MSQKQVKTTHKTMMVAGTYKCREDGCDFSTMNIASARGHTLEENDHLPDPDEMDVTDLF